MQRPAQNVVSAFVAIAVFGALWFILCRFLSNEWAINEQYNYGWFVPFFSAYLFWLRWEDRPTAENPKSQVPNPKYTIAIAIAAFALLLLLPIRFFEIAAPDWRPVAWMHAIVVVTLTLIAIRFVGGKTWLKHFAFPVAFIFVAVPWIAGIEVALVQGLMRIVASVAAEALTLCGIPAQLEGNLIRVSTGLVGVNEACSGVRSLQTSLMIGLLFGELRRFDFARRVILLFAAVIIALVANLCRAFFLVWIAAREGINATGKWHDWTGYSIVVCVFAATIIVAALLARGRSGMDEKASGSAPFLTQDLSAHPVSRIQFSTSPLLKIPVLAAILIWLLIIEVSAEAWYRSHELKMLPRVGWNVRWPESAPHFRDLPLDEKVQRVLRFDEGRGALWGSGNETTSSSFGQHLSENQKSARITYVLYFFRWQSGRSSVLRARGHRPDICLPATGWQQTLDAGSRTYSAGEIALPFRHFEFTRDPAGAPAPEFVHAFFCVQDDLITPESEAPATTEEIKTLQGLGLIPHLWHLVREGERPHGQQVMQAMIVSTERISAAEAEKRFGKLVKQLVKVENRNAKVEDGK